MVTKIKVDCLTNAQLFCKNTLGFDFDKQFIGQLRHSTRVPNTWHIIGQRYCIPLSIGDLKSGWKHIKEKAKKQNFRLKFYGTKLFDLKPFDFSTPHTTYLAGIPKYEYKSIEKDGMVKFLLPCMQLMLLEPVEFCKYDSRRIFTIGCRDLGLPPKSCEKVAKKYWSKIKETGGYKSKYQEFVKENWINFVYRNPEMYFPDWI